jgi:phosphatidylinositol alpha-1,6-mannosyltransferase
VSDAPLRVLFVTHSFPLPGDPLSNVGGMQRLAVGQHAALGRHPGVRLSTLALATAWEDTPRRMVPFMASLLAGLAGRVRRERVDAVLFSSMVTASVATLAGRSARRAGAVLAAVPVGRDVTLPSAPYQWFVPTVLRALDAVLPISRATAAECVARGAPPERVHVVPCGIEVAEFSAPAERDAARRELLAALAPEVAVPDGALLLCSVGRHQERKGFHWFVERVMPRLPADVHYLLGGDGPMTPAIRDAAARGGAEGRVHLLGRVSEETLRRLYRGADLFVMPNVPVAGDMEGFGVVMLEAGLSGMPIVAARLEGIEDAVTDGENGWLLPTGDAAAFARAIGRFRGRPPALAEASARARMHTEATFSWDAVADRYVRVLRGVIARRGA